jgi:hypothetical protein
MNAPNHPPRVLVNPIAGTCEPDTVVITPAHGRGVAIIFEIDPAAGPDWKWSSHPHPIVVEDKAGDIFTDGHHPGGNGKGTVRLMNRNLPSDIGLFKYTAHLMKDGASTVTSIDPSIQNRLG